MAGCRLAGLSRIPLHSTMLLLRESCMGGLFRPIFFCLNENKYSTPKACCRLELNRKTLQHVNWLEAVERTVTALGYELVDTERSARGLLRIFIDRVPGRGYETGAGEFITVDDCEKVTRQLQHVLEVEGGAYERLEVSSPGLDRPLKRQADYERFAGQEIELTLKVPMGSRKKFRGELLRSDPAAAGESGWRVVFHDAKGDQALDFSLSEVREARLVPVVDFKGRRASQLPADELPMISKTED